MKKTFKKIAASVMAVATLVVGSVGVTASAASNSASWSTRHVANAPGSESYSTSCTIAYSTKGADAYRNSQSNSKNGGTGKVYVDCTSHTMTRKTFEPSDTDPKHCNPTVSGVVSSVTYKFSSYTSTAYNTYKASGTVNATK